MIEDSSHNLFGTTFSGGSGDGTVFELKYLGNGSYSNSITTLATFTGSNGTSPYAGLIEDSSGDLFGTTLSGGSSGDGTVFEVIGPPTVTKSTANLAINAPTLLIQGTNFDTTPGNNSVTFNDGAVGTVTAATSTQLTVTLSTPPSATGPLTVVVTTDGGSSGAAFQVATVVPVPTVTMTDASNTYNGNAFPATATVNGGSSLEGVTPTLTYYCGTWTLSNLPTKGGSSTAPTDADSYTVVAMFPGSTDYSSASAFANFTISPANANPVASGYNTPFDGNSHTATGTATDINGNSLASLFDFSQTTHTNAGTNSDSWTFNAVGSSNYNPNYQSASGTVSDSIAQATPTVPTPTVPSNAVYNALPHGATVGDVTGVNNADLGQPKLTYYSGTWTLSNLPSSGGNSTAPTDAGSYTVVASYAGGGNYQSATSLATYSIEQATATLSVSDAGGTYNGQPDTSATGSAKGINGVAVSGSWSYTYYAGNSVSGTPLTAAPTNAETYTVVGTFTSSDSNYDGGMAQTTFTIQATSPKLTVTDTSGSYTGSSGSLTVMYGTQLLFDNTKPVHSGAALPVQLELTNANGGNISSSSITVTGTSLVGPNGKVTLQAKGNSNPNNVFRYPGGSYMFNLDTTGLASGTYTLYYTVGNDPTPHSLTFIVD